MRQTQALQVMLSGDSVFLTGPPGAGKTYVLNQFIKRATRQGKVVAVTASTGIAATHIGGTTIHSWSGLGIRDRLNDWDRQWLRSNDRLKKRYNATDVLVIDEISMLHGARLDMVNQACKILLESDEPFGGLQVILVGDLFQLPPVTRGSELLDFAHTSGAWAELNPRICYITEQHRQAGDDLLTLLEAMRSGEVEETLIEALQARVGEKPAEGAAVTRLYAHNIDVDTINDRNLAAISGDVHTFNMQTKGAAAKVETLIKSVLAPEVLELKKGAEVMFVANNFQAGYVNGSRGRVAGFHDGLPMVELTATGKSIRVEPHSWKLVEDDRTRAEVVQLPLRLAWAITIHKSQGMSLDAAEIDLSKSFTPGMGYVALSRVRSLNGIYLTGINQIALQLHPDIFEFDRALQRASAELAETTEDVPEEIKPEEGSEPAAADYDEELFAKLRAWRIERSRADKVAPFIIAHDTTLQELARRKPTTLQKLSATKGFGPKKVESYGADILEIIAANTGEAPQPKWDADTNADLLNHFHAGTPLTDLAKMFESTPEELWQHLSELLK